MSLKPPKPSPLGPGYRLDRYELLCPIASGGMASVWVARMQGKHGFEKLVAVKTILPQLASDHRFRSMFLDESRIASGVEHTNVAQILDMGEQDEILYLVMEFVDGDALSKVLRSLDERAMPPPRDVMMRILADACGGLHAAHELREKGSTALRGVVHRDVSPQNIMVSMSGTAKVIDFGVAKARDRTAKDTLVGGVKGKVTWMAPEQALGKPVDRRADIWAVGGVLYFILTGRAPFDGGNELSTLNLLAMGREAEALPSDVPEPIRTVVMRAIQHDPDKRFATALEMQRALEHAMAASGMQATQADVASFLNEHLAGRANARREAIELALREATDRQQRQPTSALPPLDAATEPGGLEAPAAFIRAGRPPPAPPARKPVGAADVDLEVPDLIVPPEPPRPPPVPAAPMPARPVASVVPPPRMIASAAGSIMGPEEREPPRDQFIDPRALAAAARSKGTAPRADSIPSPTPVDAAPAPINRNYPSSGSAKIPASVGSGVKSPPLVPYPVGRSKPKHRSTGLLWPAVGAVIVAASAVAVLMAPGYARRRCIEAARDQGFTLTMDDVSVGLGAVHLTGVTLAAPDVPIGITASEVTLSLHLFEVDAIAASSAQVTIDGDADDIMTAVERWRTGPGASRWGSQGTIRKVSVHDGRVTWTRALGGAERLTAESVGIELARAASGIEDEVHFTVPKAMLTTTRGTLGPWRVDGDRTLKGGRVRLGFDAFLPDGPSALFVWNESGTTATARIARSPLARIGIPAAVLGLTADETTQVEASIQMSRPLPSRVAGDIKIAIHDARAAGAEAKQDLVLEGQVAGDSAKPLDITGANLRFGPLKATVVGALTLYDRAFRLDMKWAIPPTPCGVLLNKQSPKEASASGLLTFDSRHPDQASFTLTSQSTCGLAIFPSQ